MYFSITLAAPQRMAAPAILAVTNVATDASGISPTSISSPTRAAMQDAVLMIRSFISSGVCGFYGSLTQDKPGCLLCPSGGEHDCLRVILEIAHPGLKVCD